MPRKKKSSFLKYLFFLIIIILGIFWHYHSLLVTPVDADDQTGYLFQIESGDSVKEIAANLKEKELINNENLFYWYVKHAELDKDIVAGIFNIKKSMNISEIAESITNIQQNEAKITIQEGLRIRDIDQKLVEKQLIQSGEFISAVKNFSDWDKYPFLVKNDRELPLEGYIYPDTYFLNPLDFHPAELISKALNNFQNKTADLHITADQLTMASIIENEVFGAKDRRIVSGILWKRLENGWPLGADATLLYITDDRHISGSDLALDSPYNTRKNGGLPPGPICNPSVDSIKAALNPEQSPYWFYLTTLDTGEVIYAKTNEEHNLNRAKYL